MPVIALPQYDLARSEKLKLAIVTGISRGFYREGDVVVGLLARRPPHLPLCDLISVALMRQFEAATRNTTAPFYTVEYNFALTPA